MSEPYKLSEIRLALKEKGLNYKLQNCDSEDSAQDNLTFLDVSNGTKFNGKIVRSFNEGEVYHWSGFNHVNIAPLLDVLNIRDDLNVFFTVDFPIKLKDIIHDGDFVYDSKCLDRKRAYARDIFSGLSYIHGKSLCLMNLSDDNIFICKLHDKAVITNFRFVTCSRKIVRDELKVPELYKPPESEKGEFEATAAEIWASGALMLDMFLAHMVPWAVINYKPRKLMDMVNKLSLELLQAANTGSVVSTVDLQKFKTFMKCFFKENPLYRITAKYACMASFLSPNFKNIAFQMKSIEEIITPNCKCVTQQTKKKSSISGNQCIRSVVSAPKSSTNLYNSVTNDCRQQVISAKCFDPELKRKELCAETLNSLNPNYAGSTSNCTEEGKKFSDVINATESTSAKLPLQRCAGKNAEIIDSEVNTKQISMENVSGIYKKTFRVFGDYYNSFVASETFLGPESTSKSCGIIEDKTNSSNELNYAHYQSKSLSFISPIVEDAGHEISFQLSGTKNCSRSNDRLSPLKQPNTSNGEGSNLYLSRLFEEKEFREESVGERVSHKVSNIVETRNLHDVQDLRYCIPKIHENFLKNVFKEPLEGTKTQPREVNSDLRGELTIQDIREKIILLRKCEISLQSHLSFFTTKEFEEKQRNLIDEYRLLLRQEKIRLSEILISEHQLSVEEIIKLVEPFNLESKCLRLCAETSDSSNLYHCCSEFSESKISGIQGKDTAMKDTRNFAQHEIKNLEIVSHPTQRRKLSYRKARQLSASQKYRTRKYRGEKLKEPEESKICLQGNKDKVEDTETAMNKISGNMDDDVKLETSNGWNDQFLHLSAEDILNTKNKACSISPESRQKRRKRSKKEPKVPRDTKITERSRKSSIFPVPWNFCFFLCPGGKVEESLPLPGDLCEACKLDYGFI